jgi:uncharacterized iron-regulated membrane protein
MAKWKLKRWLHLGHRWLGVVLGLLVLLWFVSGLIMLFVARPQLSEAERLAGLPVIEAGNVRVSPMAAWQALGLSGEPSAIRLNAAGGQPAYRILANKQWHTVNAENGQILPSIDQDSARRLAEGYAGKQVITAISPVDIDQWTVYRRFDALRPFWRVEFADGQDLYVASRSGELALDTTRSERTWNWLGSVVHWIYITPLRQNTALWRNIVLWSSFLALALVLSGFWLGWQRLRLRARYREGRVTPYREAWKRWHHLLGLAGTLVLFSWLLSGWLSLAPMELASGPKKPESTSSLLSPALDVRPTPGAATREFEWLGFGSALLKLEKQTEGSVIHLEDQPPVTALTLENMEKAVRDMKLGSVVHAAWLHEADNRYYSLRHHPRAFPVARIELDDPAATVLYISPRNGRIEVISNRHDFAYRWLYHGLHRLDFPTLVEYPLLRDITVILLSLLGSALSLTGCVLGWNRIVNKPAGAIAK